MSSVRALIAPVRRRHRQMQRGPPQRGGHFSRIAATAAESRYSSRRVIGRRATRSRCRPAPRCARPARLVATRTCCWTKPSAVAERRTCGVAQVGQVAAHPGQRRQVVVAALGDAVGVVPDLDVGVVQRRGQRRRRRPRWRRRSDRRRRWCRMSSHLRILIADRGGGPAGGGRASSVVRRRGRGGTPAPARRGGGGGLWSTRHSAATGAPDPLADDPGRPRDALALVDPGLDAVTDADGASPPSPVRR